MSDSEVPQEQENQAEEANTNDEPQDFSPGHDSKKKKILKNISTKQAAGFAAVAILFFAVGFLLPKGPAPTTGMVIGPVMTSQEAGTKAVDYINNYLLQPGYTASLISVNESNGIYSISINISSSQGSTTYPSYVTKDGNLLFVSAVDISATPEVEETEEPEPTSVPKTDKPVVNAFVMSYCPYGLQMEKAMIPVMELLEEKVSFNIDYVDYVMHGEKEMVQNNYQHCIEKDQPDKFVAYLKCFVQSDNHSKCMAEANIDSDKLDSCLAGLEEEFDLTETFKNSSATYPPYPVDSELINTLGLREDGRFGSPTFVLNGKEISVARSPEAIKSAICDAFNTPPEECNTELSSSQESPGIGALGTASTNGSGSCS